ncbi:MAG: hypothetical protein ACJA2P_000951, partial [Rhodoferax sp.]
MIGANQGVLHNADSRLNGNSLTVGIVQARFNTPI